MKDGFGTDMDGGMVRRVTSFDWGRTPLGPADSWPLELKAVVRQILESRFPAAIVWGPDYTTIYNDAFLSILGNKPDTLGRSFADIWAEAWHDIRPIAERAYAGEATYIEDFPLTIDRDGRAEQAWFTFCYSPLRLSDGTVVGMLDTVIETTATVKARIDLSLINDELGHRLKNTLTLVQAIATQTLKGVEEREAVTAFQQRLGTLGRAHDILLQQDWSGASFLRVVRDTLLPLGGPEQIVPDGPDIVIGSRAVMSLTLMLHELATNAAKYGALSVPSGRVSLNWALEGDRLLFRWRESGGPAITEPTRRGFGSRLIDRGFGGGTVERRYPPTGFELDYDVPASLLAE